MQTKSFSIDNKDIFVFDDVLTYSEHLGAYKYALNSKYSVSRTGSDLPEDRFHQRTLSCYMNPIEVLSQGLMCNKTIKNYVEQKKLRIKNYYITLGTSSDTYPYHTDDIENADNETLLCYLNTKWDPTWEGETHFSNKKAEEVLYTSSFIPGRVVIFNSGILHKSSQPSFDAKVFRFVAVAKLVGPKSPLYNTGINLEDFIYDTSTVLGGISNQERRALSALQSITNNVNHSNTTLYNHLFNTFCLLKAHGASQDVCLAGLYHSIYGTTYFKPNIQIDKETVIDLIGENAENLVSCFCSAGDIDYKIMNNTFKLNVPDWLGLLQIFYANDIEQTFRLPFQFNDEVKKLAIVKNKIQELTKENNNNE